MNCDQVFEVLTRGPFPSGSPQDAQVESHLTTCHTCRQLAEALRPAVDLLHEAVFANDFHGLPEYRGRMAETPAYDLPASVDTIVAGTVSVELPKRRTVPKQQAVTIEKTQKPVNSRSLATLVGISLVVLVLLQASGLLNTSDLLRTAGAGPVQEGEPNPAGRRLLASLDISTDCFHTRAEDLSKAEKNNKRSTKYHCCTQCHSAAHTAHGSFEVAALARSCRACHAM